GHRLDVINAPARRRRFDGGTPPRTTGAGDPREVTHAFHAPTGTAFKLGFGFAAGVAAFRAIVLAIVGLAVLVASVQIVHRLFG
ncbi:MAG TPA: hypothetical protein VMT28_15485, partial [Terriglobales bacterium]|nr:hypothetical protein [Terriglobales bacterium]